MACNEDEAGPVLWWVSRTKSYPRLVHSINTDKTSKSPTRSSKKVSEWVCAVAIVEEEGTRRRLVTLELKVAAMKKFTFKGVLDGFRQTVQQQSKVEQEIPETLRSEHFQLRKVRRILSLTFNSFPSSSSIGPFLWTFQRPLLWLMEIESNFYSFVRHSKVVMRRRLRIGVREMWRL